MEDFLIKKKVHAHVILYIFCFTQHVYDAEKLLLNTPTPHISDFN